MTKKEKMKMGRPKVARERNGAIEPIDSSSIRGKIWTMCDRAFAKTGKVPMVSTIIQKAAKRGIKEATVRNEYVWWRKFHGFEGAGYVKKKKKA